MSLYFTSDIDKQRFDTKIAQMQKQIHHLGGNVEKEANKMNEAFRAIATSIGTIISVTQGWRLVNQIVQIRGEMQQIQQAYEVILKSAEKGQKLMQDTVAFAAETPFDVLEVAAGAKQLLAYGSTAESVIGELRMLGDVASAVKVPIEEIIYLYGTLRTQGKVLWLDIRQFAGRGIPIYKELAKVLGVAESSINNMVTQGRVNFDHIEQAFKNMTSAGGIFEGLMDRQSKTVTGRLSNLSDAVIQMWNKIGESQEGVIYDTIEGLKLMVDNYDDVLRVLGQVITLYGTYKAALLLIVAVQKTLTLTTALSTNIRLIAMMRKEIGLLTAVQQAFNLTAWSNPYVWVPAALAAIGGLVLSLKIWKGASEEVKEELSDFAKITQQVTESTEDEVAKVRLLYETLRSANTTYDQKAKALAALQKIVPSYLGALDKEGRLIKDNKKVIAEYIKSLEKAAKIKAVEEINVGYYKTIIEAEKQIAELEEKRRNLQTATQFIPKAQLDSQLAFIDQAISLWQDKVLQARKDINKNLAFVGDEETSTDAEVPLTKEMEKARKKYADAILKIQQDLYDAEVDLRRQKITDEKELIDFEAEIKIEAIEKEKVAFQQLAVAAGLASSADEVDVSKYDNLIKIMQQAAKLSKEQLEQENTQEVLEQVRTYEQKKLAILEEFRKKRALMFEDEGQLQLKVGFSQENLDELDRQLNAALVDLDFSNLELLKSAFGEIEGMTRGRIITSLEVLRTKLRDVTDPEQIKLFTDQIHELEDALHGDFSLSLPNDLEAAIRATYKLIQIQKQLNKAKAEGSGYTKEEILALEAQFEKQQDQVRRGFLGSGIGLFVDSLQFAVDKMKELAEASGDIHFQELVSELEDLTTIIGSIGAGFATGGWVGALIGGLTSIVDVIISGFVQAKKSVLEYNQSLQDFADRMELLKYKFKGDDWDTIFGTNSMGKAVAALSSYMKAIEKYNELVNKTTSFQEWMYEQGEGELYELIIGGFTVHEEQAAHFTELYQKYMKEASDAFTDLQNLQIKTKDYGWWHELWGYKDEYTSLKDIAPELWDASGKLDIDALKAFLATNKQLTEEQRKQLELIIQMQEEADAAYAAFEQYLQETYGELGTGAIEAVTQSLIDGTDAWKNYGDTVANVIRKVIEDVAYNLFLAKDLENLKKLLEEIYADTSLTEEEKVDKINQLLKDYYTGVKDNLENAKDFLKEQEDYWGEQGIHLYDKEDERPGMEGKGIGKASQESVDENNALLTTSVTHTYKIMTTLELMYNLSMRSMQYQTSMLIQIQMIHKLLSQVRDSSEQVHNAVKLIGIKGVKIK